MMQKLRDYPDGAVFLLFCMAQLLQLGVTPLPIVIGTLLAIYIRLVKLSGLIQKIRPE